MNKIITLAFFVLVSVYANAAEDMSKILSLKPGDKYDPRLKDSKQPSSITYSVEEEKGLIRSVAIEFKKPVDVAKHLSPKTEGFCLIQPSKGDVNMNRYFFFNKETNKRYELSSDKKLIGILIQEMPGAREHKPCTIESFNLKGDK